MGLFKRCSCFCVQTTEEDVKELDYSHCCLEDVPVNVFSNERTLESVKLDSNQIRDLPRVCFKKLLFKLNNKRSICHLILGTIPL